jgi:hypothetical protein
MRTAILALAVLLLVSVSAASASIVIHDGQPGIVAMQMGRLLDSNGHVWVLDGPGWLQELHHDPPMPLDQIKFWEYTYLVTMDDVVWYNPSSSWVCMRTWPTSAAPETIPAAMTASPKTIPNPSAGTSRVAFQTAAVGPDSVRLFDATGRLVRQLYDGPLPAGEFSLTWDGREDGGNPAPGGIYFAKVTTPAGESTTKLVFAR